MKPRDANASATYLDLAPEELPRIDPGTRIIDVRTHSEFEGPLCRVPSAECVPLEELEGAAGLWDRRAPLLVVCQSGRRSALAARWLVAQGFGRVANLRGGMLAYRALGLPRECAS